MQEVIRRQKIIQILARNKPLRLRLLALLNDFKEKHEKPFIAQYREDHALRLSRQLAKLKRQYTRGASLSENPIYKLELLKRWAVDVTFLSIVVNSFLTFISLCYKIPSLFPNSWIGTFVKHLLRFLDRGYTAPRNLRSRELFYLRYEAFRALLFMVAFPTILTKFYYIHYDTLGAYAEAFYHQKKWYAMVRGIYDLVQEDKELANLCEDLLEDTSRLISGNHDNEGLGTYLDLLRTQRLTSFSIFFSFGGKLLKTVGLFEQQYQNPQLLNTIYEISTIGVLVHLAHYMEHAKDRMNRLSYVDFVVREEPTAFIHIKGLWNPCISSDKAVPDDVYLEGSKANVHMYLGSNAGGKTTKAKALGVAVAMAQVYGLSPAKSALHTFFDALLTYYNIQDGDFVTGLSQYTSELERIEYLLNNLERLGPSKNTLCLVDEPATGTGEAFAKILTSELVKYLIAHYPNSGFFFITHYKDLRSLAQHHRLIENYSVVIEHINDVNFRYKYTMTPGTPSKEDDAIALKILGKRENFPEKLRKRIKQRVEKEI